MENIELSVTLPRILWEQLHELAQIEYKDETTLLIRAIEQFIKQDRNRLAFGERLDRECQELANMEFEDIGTEDEWLIIQNEALTR